MSEGFVMEKNLYLKGPAKKIIKRIMADIVKSLIEKGCGLFFEIYIEIEKATKAAPRPIQPPRLKVVIIPMPHNTRETLAHICSFFISDLMISAIVSMNNTDKKAAYILGSVSMPQHLVRNSSLEAGSSHVAGIGGACMYSTIEYNPCKRPVRAPTL